MTRLITVTQPNLPPLEEFIPYLQQIWESRQLTNGGPFHQQLERALCEYLGVGHIALFNNGTTALVTAIQALRLQGEVITTPYSFVATAHSLLWNRLHPVFVDVDPHNFGLSPEKIEAAITPATTAIMPVHCYGYPCDVDAIGRIADKYNLRVIYDAAHAFGVRDEQGTSILRHGDLSVLSFHATKVFNTFEGGAIVCPDAKTKQHIDYLKNFGFADETTVVASGINGKMSEIQAAFGLLNLEHLSANLAARTRIAHTYREGLSDLPGITLPSRPDEGHNHAYFPILVEPDYRLSRDDLYQRMREAGIHGRRYFYPLISSFPMYRNLPSARPGNLPVAQSLADRVICLPLYPNLAAEDVNRVIEIIRHA
jgi:dTDP-4-amino-4,6-dideoxygalactose transaminase